MKMQYTKHQIIETIKHWQNVLKTMNESRSELLNAFAQKFSSEVAFSRKPFMLTNESAMQIAKIINDVLFESMIVDFPDIRVVTYGQYCKIIKFYEVEYCNKLENEITYSKNNFFGEYYNIIENDFNTLKWNDKLDYSHEIVFMNLDKLKYRSFIMNASALCHEMIHVYDKQFGDGEGLDKYCILKHLDSDEYNKLSHNTKTFVDKKELAIANNLNVMTTIDKKDKILDKETINLMLQALTPEEIQLVKESYANDSKDGKKRKISLRLTD